MARNIKIIDKTVVILNMFVYRVDALCANFIDGMLLVSYGLAIALTLGYRVNVNNIDIWIHTTFSLMLFHLLYMVVYVINDVIDYRGARNLKPGIDSSFYQLRPIYFFRSSKTIVAYFAIFYAVVIILISTLSRIPHPFVFAGIVALLAFLHSSQSISLRIITFYLLRIAKYVYLSLFSYIFIIDGFYKNVLMISIVSLVIPYATYTTLNYVKQFSSEFKTRVLMILSISVFLLSSLLLLLGNALNCYSWRELVRAIIVSYIFTVLPMVGVRQGLRKLLGAHSPTYHHHMLRLFLGAILTITILFFTLNILGTIV